MRILLVDDEELQLLRLVNTVKSVLKDEELLSFSNPDKALEEAKKNRIDLAFLDIEMPHLNGIQLAKKLKAINPQTKVIFVTAYDNYALDAFKVHASGYVTKPVNVDKIKKELEQLEGLVELQPTKKIQIKCFGNFEIFYQGEPVKFAYQKSKEVVAYLVDREGSMVNVNELNAVLWEEDHKSYLRNLIADIKNSLTAINCGDVFIKRHNECAIDINKVDCDAFEYKKDNPDAVRMYRGEYMIQYHWAVFKDE
ncbi:MAG: response regulator [Bacilli bacterium]|nr:response regulator [Bacilli bacterium]